MSACYLHHLFSPSLSRFPNNPHYPSPHAVRLPTERSVRCHWRSVSFNVQRLRSFTVYSQQPTLSRNDINNNTANIKARSDNNWCSGRALIIIHCSVCICSVSYLACNVRAAYCRLWPVRMCKIFPHIYLTRNGYRKKVTEHKMSFDFLYEFDRNISHSKKKWES